MYYYVKWVKTSGHIVYVHSISFKSNHNQNNLLPSMDLPTYISLITAQYNHFEFLFVSLIIRARAVQCSVVKISLLIICFGIFGVESADFENTDVKSCQMIVLFTKNIFAITFRCILKYSPRSLAQYNVVNYYIKCVKDFLDILYET